MWTCRIGEQSQKRRHGSTLKGVAPFSPVTLDQSSLFISRILLIFAHCVRAWAHSAPVNHPGLQSGTCKNCEVEQDSAVGGVLPWNLQKQRTRVGSEEGPGDPEAWWEAPG